MDDTNTVKNIRHTNKSASGIEKNGRKVIKKNMKDETKLYNTFASQNATNIAVLTEKMSNMDKNFATYKEEVKTGFTEVKIAIEDLSNKIDDKFVSKDQFRPYQVVLGLVGTAVVLFIVNLFLGLIDFK